MKKSTSIVFFIDRCLGKKIADILRNARAKVEIHDDHFPQNMTDAEWLSEVGKRDWVVLTKDENIGYRTIEQLAIAQANVKVFVLASAHLSGQEMADIFVNSLSNMEKFVLDNLPPFIAKIYKFGKIIKWKNKKKLLKKLPK